MDKKSLAEFLAIMDKMKIYFDSNLNEYEKEVLKEVIDYCKEQAKK